MKAADVHVGATYLVKVSHKIAPVLIESRNGSAFLTWQNGYWAGMNLRTGRTILVKTSQRLRRLLTRAERAEIDVPLSDIEHRYYASLTADDPSDPAWAKIAEKVEGEA